MPAERDASELPVLDPLYYRDNFETLCKSVRAQYFDLLKEPELEFFQRYELVDEAARCLYVRLVSRRGLLFRSEQLSYPELGPLEPAIAQLCEAGLAQVSTSPEPEQLLHLLRKDELLAIYRGSAGLAASLRKSDMQLRLLTEFSAQELLDAWQAWCAPGCYLLEICYQDCIDLLQLLFFGNSRQNLTEFVLTDLGVTRYWNYDLDPQYRLFESRAQIDDYRRLNGMRDLYYKALEAEDTAAVNALVEPLLDAAPTPWLQARRDRLRNRVARQLERYQAWEPALTLYGSSDVHPARERRVRILQSLERYREALSLCEAMLEQPWCEAELDFLRRQLPMLRKRLAMPHQPAPREVFPGELLELSRAPKVELAVAKHYAQSWEQVHFVENALLNATFGLAFWEQIFQPLAGAFVNPFQSAPLDMYSGDFYRARRTMIDARLAELARTDLEGELLKAFDSYRDTSNRWVSWRYLSRDLLQKALKVIPRDDWISLWRRILFDPQANRSGFPDLVALDEARGYCFIEVKGPGDQLQLNQKRWLRYFEQQGIPALVSWVQWRDD